MVTETVTVGDVTVLFDNASISEAVTIMVPGASTLYISASYFDDLLEAMQQIRDTVDRREDS